MFNGAADFAPSRERLRRSHRALIPHIFAADIADRIHAALAAERNWDLCYRDGGTDATLFAGDHAALDVGARARKLADIAHAAVGRYAYAYDHYPMIDRYLAARDDDHPLQQLVNVFHSEPVLDFLRALVGDAGIRRVKMQATRYLPGHFLRRHNDTSDSNEDRRYAFVFNLGRDWRADWGGLLQFLDEAGNVIDTFLPAFNSLSLFRVPQWHQVSLVAPWAEQPRYALTGWLTP
ncbi:MAG: 2OG-Fe(II) oxygenase [Proteobacteria bacterium]|nr:2OG-Fe(II) oxygenase [Pseudomonadota bacterium]